MDSNIQTLRSIFVCSNVFMQYPVSHLHAFPEHIHIPDDDLGEEVAAVIVLRPGASAPADSLRKYVKDWVAPYKCTRVIEFCGELPKTPAGKIFKRGISPGG